MPERDMVQMMREPQSVIDPLMTQERLAAVYKKARTRLLSLRNEDGYWTGELASSALSTATALCALLLVDRAHHGALASGGIRWLLDHQNSDGGWGDTLKSFSNISTTMLCRAALSLGKGGLEDDRVSLKMTQAFSSERIEKSLRRAESYLESVCGGREPETLARAVRARYGKDRTFSVPILSCCALTGVTGWDEVPALPFELACFPASAYRWLNLPVVSYALPALIALGLVHYTKRPPRNPVTRMIRRAAAPRVLRKLESIQPSNGGFLEATPLVSFVTMSLAGAGLAAHPVAKKGVDFLLNAVRPDGSWPIDTNLSTWVTTLSVNALYEGAQWPDDFPGDEASAAEELRRWLLEQQYNFVHPFTSATPGGWGWTPLPGAVPDADDTAGALIALRKLGVTPQSREAALAGLEWLLALQNRDGGWPTFCRGWGYLPFDRSSADITAHALRALHLWSAELHAPCLLAYRRRAANEAIWKTAKERAALSQRLDRAIQNGLRFLAQSQRPDGSWVPLWFGNQHAPDDENPTYGTARVLSAYRDLNLWDNEVARRGRRWLVACQSDVGGWGGAQGTPPSIEETALAVEALLECGDGDREARSTEALTRGLRWLVERVEDDSFIEPSPIGFYFAKLWYFEELYPLIFTVGALGRALRLATASEPAWIQTETSTGRIYV